MTDLIGPADAETHTVEENGPGAPVDPPERPKTLHGTVTGLADADRVPIIPGWWRNREQRRMVLRHGAATAGYLAAFHAVRLPKYVAVGAIYVPRGAYRAVARPVAWAWAEEGNWHLRQEAANRNQPEEWRKLDAVRERQSRWRWWVLAVVALALFLAGAITVHTLSAVWLYALAAAALVPLARLGRPADRPITDRVHLGQRFTRLTAEMVREAVASIGVLRKDEKISFVREIHADGPGYMASFELPNGRPATDVMERREELSSALRLPVDQIWPERPDGEHAGRVDLWVGFRPASKMPAPDWALAAPDARTSLFVPQPFAVDARQRPIMATLFESNWLIGGQPGSGKSYGGRALAQVAALDPLCRMRIGEFKGTGDFLDLAPLCDDYVVGVDEEALAHGLRIVEWALAECERRGPLIRAAKERGDAPEGKLTPQLVAADPRLRLVFIVLDEVHELFAAHKDAAVMAERAIKRGRALGVIFVLATQIPDKTSLPPNIVRCVSNRWCMSVGGQQENDMILGTGAYKRGQSATGFRPQADAGWGVLNGNLSGTARSYFPSPEVAARIVARATELRGGPAARGRDDRVETRNTLADALTVMAGRPALSWQEIAEGLAELDPVVYADMTADMAREALARFGVESKGVKRNGHTVRGARRDAIQAANTTPQIDSP